MSDTPDTIRDAHFRQLNAHREDPAYAGLDGYEERAAFFDRQVGRKWEIDEAVYDESLNLLPPAGYRSDSFYLSEFLFDDITHRFSREGERYFYEVARYPERPKREALAVPIGPVPKPWGRSPCRCRSCARH